MPMTEYQIKSYVHAVTAPSWKFWKNREEAALELLECGPHALGYLSDVIEAIKRENASKMLFPLFIAAAGMLRPFSYDLPDPIDWKQSSSDVRMIKDQVKRRFSTDPDDEIVRAVDEISRYLEYSDNHIQELALSVIAGAGFTTEHAREKINLLRKSPITEIAAWAHACKVNIEHKNDGAMEFLTGVLTSRKPKSTLHSVAHALFMSYGINRRSFIPDMIEVIKVGRDGAISQTCLTIGWELTSVDAECSDAQLSLPALVDLLLTCDIDTYNGLAGVFQVIGPAAVPYLVDVLTNEKKNKDNKLRCANTLGFIGPCASVALPELRKLATRFDDDGVVSSAIVNIER